MARFGEEMNNLRKQDRETPAPKMSKSEKEMADVHRQIKVDQVVDSRLNKLLNRH